MIHSFKVKNFYSINDEIEIDFVAKEGSIAAPELYLDAPFDKKVTKVAFVGGANGSGKTNILRVLAFMRFMIVGQSGGSKSNSNIISFFPFELSKDKVSMMAVVFSVNDRLYEYELVLTQKEIIEEKLFLTSVVEKRATKKKVFSRILERGIYDVDITSSYAKNLRNVEGIEAVLSLNRRRTIVDLYSDIDAVDGAIREVKEFWLRMFTNIMSFGNLESEFSTSKLANDALGIIGKNGENDIISNSILKSADVGFGGVNEFRDTSEGSGLSVYGIQHNYDNASFTFPIMRESAGTNRIIYLAREISELLSREEGGIAVIDDMDAFLHPDVYELLIEQFMSPTVNKNGTQLIMSSHNYMTLNLLDKQQIILTERGMDGATEAWRLDQMEGVDSRDNFYAKYMAGKYGAVPRIGV